MTVDTRTLDTLLADTAVPADLAGLLDRDQVFGPVVERSGTTVIPVAKVRATTNTGRNGALAARAGNTVGARPAGAFVITPDGKVAWHPAVDVNRIVLGGQVVVGAVLVLGIALNRIGRSRAGNRNK